MRRHGLTATTFGYPVNRQQGMGAGLMSATATILLAIMMLLAPAAYADTGDDYEYQLAIGGVNVINEDGSVNESALPAGVQFNSASRMLTLTDCTLDISGTEASSFIQCKNGFTNLKIVLNGQNVFRGTTSAPEFVGIDVPGAIDIDGTGSLTMDLSGCSSNVTGIRGQDNIQIANSSYSTGTVSLDILGGSDEKDFGFTGINMYRYRNYCAEDGKQHQIKIKNAKLNISNTTLGSSDYNPCENIGIESNDSDVDISDSIISMDLTNGSTCGIKCGLRNPDQSGGPLGGKLSINDYYSDDGLSTRVSIRMHNAANENPCAVVCCEDNVNLSYKYMANPEDESDVTWLQGFYHQWQTANGSWLESHYRFLELSADYIAEYASDDLGEDPFDDPAWDEIDPAQPVKLLGTNIVVPDGNDGYMAKTTGIPGVTGTIAYNIMTRTLTLDNCTFNGGSSDLSYIESEGPLKIALKGDNTFKGAASAGSYESLFGIHVLGELYISGSGTITMDFRTFDGPVTGIQGDNIIEINGPTIKMIGSSPDENGLSNWHGILPSRRGDFYGIRMDPAMHNFYDRSHEYDGDDSYDGPDFHIGIYNATINVFNACSSMSLSGNLAYFRNAGVEANDSNLYIENSRIKLKMIGSVPKGLLAGLYRTSSYDHGRYGGKLSIDEKSWITIELLDSGTTFNDVVTLQFFQAYDPDTYEYVSVHDFIKSPYIYVGDQIGYEHRKPITWVLWNESLEGTEFAGYWSEYLIENEDGYRVCEHQGLELSPQPVTPGQADPSDPAPEEQKPYTPTPSNTTTKTTTNTSGKTAAKVGTEVKVKSGTVKITSTKKKTATFSEAKNQKTVTIPDSIMFNQEKFVVTGLDKNAFKNSDAINVVIGKNVNLLKKAQFKGTNVKKVTLKTKLLTSASVKGSLKGSKVKTIKVKVGAKKIVKKFVAKYKKIFTKKNAGKKVTVK